MEVCATPLVSNPMEMCIIACPAPFSGSKARERALPRWLGYHNRWPHVSTTCRLWLGSGQVQ